MKMPFYGDKLVGMIQKELWTLDSQTLRLFILANIDFLELETRRVTLYIRDR